MWMAADSGLKPYPPRPVVDTIVLRLLALSSSLISGVSLGWAKFSTPALGEGVKLQPQLSGDASRVQIT